MQIIEKIELHDTLNPKIWEDNKLREGVKDKLIEISDQFILELHENDIPIKVLDARLVGSNASFNYTENSDIDLHLIADLQDVSCDTSVLNLLYNYFKSNFNDKYNISIHGIPVELYIEDMNSSSVSNGIYSLYNDEWIKFPEPIEVPDIDITDDFAPYENKYNTIIEDDDSEGAEKLVDELYLLRKDSLALEGEYGVGNLIFKEFRNKGYLDKLKELVNLGKSKELSLESLNEGRDANLYHATSLSNFLEMIKSDTLKRGRRFMRDIKMRNEEGSISLTRSYDFVYNYPISDKVILILNQAKLANNYKITPVGDQANSLKPQQARNAENSKAEEIITKEISPLGKYLDGVIIEPVLTDEQRNIITEYCNKYGIYCQMNDSRINEGLDKQSDLYPIAKEIMNLWAEAHSSNLSFSNEPKGHAFFIFPDGRFLSGFGAHYEIEEVIQALDKSNYPDVNISGDDYYIYSTLSDLGCVRGRFDKYENYFQLSQIRPTYEQYDSIEWALDIMQRQNISNRVFIETPNKGESKVYTFNDYTTDEIISKIKRYYTSGILYEGVENTVKNAIRQYDNYVRKYGEKEALFNLKYNYFLQDEELVYIINYLIKNNHMGNDIAKWNVEYLQLNDYISEIKFKTEDDNDDISLADIAKQYGVELKNSYENNSNLSELNEELKDRNWIINQFKIAFKKYMQNIPSADELFNKKLDNISESEWLDIEDFVESLKFPLVIYRGLKVNSPEEINKRDIGVNWTIDEELFFAPNSAFKGSNYVLATKVNENQVNFPETIQNFIYYSLRPQYGMYPEQEVTLNINPKLSDVVVLKKEGEELIPVTKLNLSEAYLDSEERFWDYGTGLITGNNVFDIGTNESSYGKKMIQYAESGKETSDGKRAAFIQLTPNEYFEACAEGFGNSVTSQIRQVADDEGVIDDLFTVIDVFERQFPVTYLDYSEDVFSQEGRHRMYVAGEKFGWNTKFPVLLIWKPGHKPSMGKETEEIQTFISNDELADELDYDDLEALDD